MATTIRRELEGRHSLGTIRAELSGLYSATKLRTEITGLYYEKIRAVYEGVYSFRQPVREEVGGLFDIKDTLAVRNEITGLESGPVRNEYTGQFSIRGITRNELTGEFSMTNHVANEIEGSHDLLTYIPIRNETKSVFSYISSVVTSVTGEPKIIHNGLDVPIIEAQVAIDEGGVHWTANIQLADINDYSLFRQDDQFILDLFGEQWTFLVDAKELDRSNPADIRAGLVGISPTALLDFPRADPYSKEWRTFTTAKEAAEDAVGATITNWDIVDWTLPPYRLVVEDVSPLSVVQLIAEAAGGTVESDLDGTLLVRHLYPTSTLDYETATPDHYLYETHHILRSQENFAAGRIYNRFRLLDQEADYADVLEWLPDPDDPYKGVLFAYPSPWRTADNTHVRCTTSAIITLLDEGFEERVEDARSDWLASPEEPGEGELIEIFDGRAQTQYPIWGIDSIDWQSDPLAGGLTFTEGSSTITTVNENDLYGLLRLKYQVRYYRYAVELTDRTILSQDVQFLMEDLTEDA